MNEFVVQKTSVWSDMRRGNRIRQLAKQRITQYYPFNDHQKCYVYKPKGQRGPARNSQTFTVSFAYCGAVDRLDHKEFLELVEDAGLRVCRYKTTFRGANAYKIIVANDAVNILHALELLPMDPDEQQPNVLPYPQWSILRSWFENPIPSLADIKRLQNTPGIPLRSKPNCYTYKCPHLLACACTCLLYACIYVLL